MLRPRLATATLATALACLSAAPALGAQDVLVAQLAQVAQEPAPGELPPLRERVPGLDGEREPVPPPPNGGDSAEPGPELPATGSESVVLVLGGFGLLAAGAGLRLSADAVLRA